MSSSLHAILAKQRSLTLLRNTCSSSERLNNLMTSPTMACLPISMEAQACCGCA